MDNVNNIFYRVSLLIGVRGLSKTSLKVVGKGRSDGLADVFCTRLTIYDATRLDATLLTIADIDGGHLEARSLDNAAGGVAHHGSAEVHGAKVVTLSHRGEGTTLLRIFNCIVVDEAVDISTVGVGISFFAS